MKGEEEIERRKRESLFFICPQILGRMRTGEGFWIAEISSENGVTPRDIPSRPSPRTFYSCTSTESVICDTKSRI